MNPRELIGLLLASAGAAGFGILLGPALAGAQSLTPLEAMLFLDGVAAIVIGFWMFVFRTKS